MKGVAQSVHLVHPPPGWGRRLISGPVGDMKNSVVSPSDIFHRIIVKKRRSSTICVEGI